MTTRENTGGAAFPGPYSNVENQGLTMRDYFAAKAMQTLVAESHENIMEWHFDSEDMPTDIALAKAAYLLADAMLGARK